MEINNSEEKRFFEMYVLDFGVSIESLKNKSVLDIGCGTDALFVRYCFERGINIMGVDDQEPQSDTKEVLKDRYIKSDLSTIALKPESFDLILMRAVPIADMAILVKLTGLLAINGEFKIVPWLGDHEPNEADIDKFFLTLDHDKFETTKKVLQIQEINGKQYPRHLLTIKRK